MTNQLNPPEDLELILQREAQLRAAEKNPDPGLALRRAELLEILARYPDALSACAESAAIREKLQLPADPAVCKAEASVLFRMDRHTDSLSAVVASARLRNEQGLPEDWELSKIRGNCLCRIGRHNEALAAYSRAEQIQIEQGQPVYPYLPLNRGAVYQELGQLEDALAEFDKTEQLLAQQGQTPHPNLFVNRGVVLSFMYRFEEALAAYEQAGKLLEKAGLPEDVNLLMNLADVYSELGRTAEALKLFARSEELRRERGQAPSFVLYFHRAMAQRKAGHLDLAIAEAMRSIGEASRQGIPVKPFYAETLQDWLSPGAHAPTAPDTTRQLAVTQVLDSEKRYDAFLSYRRNPGKPYAMLLKTHLDMQQKSIFRDEEDLPAGSFRADLMEAIRHTRHMIVLLTEDFFERCQDPDDVVRLEIASALNCGTHIIPVMLEGFSWPKAAELPEEIRAIASLNAMSFSTEFFSAFLEKLLRWMGNGHDAAA